MHPRLLYRLQEYENETVRDDNIPATLDALREMLEDTEQEWQDRILDYIAENYPTQTTVSAQTRSPEGLKEREAMKKDKTLRKMKEEAVAALNATDEKVMEAFKKRMVIYSFVRSKKKTAASLGGPS